MATYTDEYCDCGERPITRRVTVSNLDGEVIEMWETCGPCARDMFKPRDLSTPMANAIAGAEEG